MKAIIDEIVKREWSFFDKVNNIGGRASCQDDWGTFSVMRISQFEAWDAASLESYLSDLKTAEQENRNPLTEKYGYMMCIADPEENRTTLMMLPPVSEEKKRLSAAIMDLLRPQNEQFARSYPHIAMRARPLHTEEDAGGFTSMETYEIGELWSYSERTLSLLKKHIENMSAQGISYAESIITNSLVKKGFPNIAEAEKFLAERDNLNRIGNKNKKYLQ